MGAVGHKGEMKPGGCGQAKSMEAYIQLHFAYLLSLHYEPSNLLICPRRVNIDMDNLDFGYAHYTHEKFVSLCFFYSSFSRLSNQCTTDYPAAVHLLL